MPSTKEIRNHIASVNDTRKITNAMYLIASTKMRRAKNELDQTRPFFDSLRTEIKRIFRTVKDIESQYFFPLDVSTKIEGTYGYLVITADKGLAGAYNQNVIKEAMRLMYQHDDNKLFVIGEYGRQFFMSKNIPIEQSFEYTAQNPTLHRAREIGSVLLEEYEKGALKKIFIIYTDFSNSMNAEAVSTRLLPFHRTHFATTKNEKVVKTPFTFYPSVEEVLDHIIPTYTIGFIYSAMVDSFCSEQNARMTAMDSANQNAQKLLDQLNLQYNHVRQNAITGEIIEISSGAKWQMANKEIQ